MTCHFTAVAVASVVLGSGVILNYLLRFSCTILKCRFSELYILNLRFPKDSVSFMVYPFNSGVVAAA